MDELITCTKCNSAKAPGDFPKRISGRLASWCRTCTNTYQRERMRERRKDPTLLAAERAKESAARKTDEYRAKARAYRKQPEQRAKEKPRQQAYQREYYKRPEVVERERARSERRLAAMRAVSPAWAQKVRDAELFEKGLRECRKCGVVKSIELFSPKLKKAIHKLQSWCHACVSKKTGEWCKTPNGKANSKIQFHKRRARLKAAPGRGVTRQDWAEIQAAFLHRCAYCQTDAALTMDHVVAITKGGQHDTENVVPACMPCNANKRALPFERACRRLGVDSREVELRIAAARARLACPAPLREVPSP